MEVTTNPGQIQSAGMRVEVICSVELRPVVSASEASLLTVTAQLSFGGATLTPPTTLDREGATFTLTYAVESFSEGNVGEYACMATVSPQPQTPYITGNGTRTGSAMLSIGETHNYFMLLLTLFHYSQTSIVEGGAQSGGSAAGIAVGVVILIIALAAAIITAGVVVWFVMRY